MSRSARLIPTVLLAAGATSIASACGITSTTDCCSMAGIARNTTRRCGFFNDQDCPDKTKANTSNLSHAVEADSGKKDRTEAGSFTRNYQIGRCTGSFGSNLCAYDPEQTTTCTTSGATGADCKNTTVNPQA